jgi:hypothetical protein
MACTRSLAGRGTRWWSRENFYSPNLGVKNRYGIGSVYISLSCDAGCGYLWCKKGWNAKQTDLNRAHTSESDSPRAACYAYRRLFVGGVSFVSRFFIVPLVLFFSAYTHGGVLFPTPCCAILLKNNNTGPVIWGTTYHFVIRRESDTCAHTPSAIYCI